MRAVIYIAAVGLVGALYLSTRKRVLTKADLPKLSELMLRKTRLGLAYQLCIKKRGEKSLLSFSETLSIATGLFVGVATSNPNAGLAAARTVAGTIDSVKGGKTPCATELAQLEQELLEHDALAEQLGFSTSVTYEAVQAEVKRLGGFDYTAQRRATYDRCVKFHGQYYCDQMGVKP